jgi:hypothetical protein
LTSDWDPGVVDLLVVGPRAEVSETLALCRFLAFSSPYSSDFRQAQERSGLQGGPGHPTRRIDAPLLVLVNSDQGSLVGAVLEAGAHTCLMLPLYANNVSTLLAQARAACPPAHNAPDADQIRREGAWQDDGGRG